MPGDIYDLTSGKRLPITRDDYMSMVDAMEKYIIEIRRITNNPVIHAETLSLLDVVRFNAYFSQSFRENSRDHLREIVDDMYIRLVELPQK